MHQPKIRINDLAREMEVRSKSILDALPFAGIFQKKTHSSSLDADDADKVRAYFRAKQVSSGQAVTRRIHSIRAKDEIRTKVDVVHSSRPGDVPEPMTKRTQALHTGQPSARPVRGQPIYRRPTLVQPSTTIRPATPSKRAAPTAAPPSDVLQAIAQRTKTPPLPVARSVVSNSSQPSVQPVRGQPKYRRPILAQPSTTIRPASPEKRATPAGPLLPRVIMPHTGPRPVYAVSPPLHPTGIEAAAPTSEQKIGGESTINQAEEALKILRAQEKQKPRDRDPEY